MIVASYPPTVLAAFGSAGIATVAGGVTILLVLVGGIGWWRLFGKGPRRHRAYRRIREFLLQGNWQAARDEVRTLRSLGTNSPLWLGRADNVEGEVHRLAADVALSQGQFEEALHHAQTAAKFLGAAAVDGRKRVLESLLAELRARVAAGADEQAAKLINRATQLQSPCPEAAFWQGILSLRQNRFDQAATAFRTVIETSDQKRAEPYLYLGMVLIRDGKTKDGLRALAEANRLSPNSPLVGWQLGTALVVVGGDATLAVRALQKALAPSAMPALAATPDRFWAECLGEDAFVAKLAAKTPFICPMLGGSVPGMVRQAKIALGQALLRLDRATESASVFQELLAEGAPTVAILRHLGIALVKLERHDDAFAHLRSAAEMEQPKNPMTACYLAFSSVKARPSREEDRPANVRWAVRQLIDVPIPVDAEAARLACGVYAEARTIGVPVPVEEQLRLCDTLVALGASDPAAAAAFDHLYQTMPDAIRAPHTFLYGQAAATHGLRLANDLDLLVRIFRQEPAARDYFARQNWNLDAVERLMLERWSEKNPGRVPEGLRDDYAARIERKLLDQAAAQEAKGDADTAKQTIALLARLSPDNRRILDRLARLAWQRGDFDEAASRLRELLAADPPDPMALVRLAAVEFRRGETGAIDELLRRAMALSTGDTRTTVARLAARIMLASDRVDEAIRFLSEAPLDQDSVIHLALAYWRKQDLDGLAALSGRLPSVAATDAKTSFVMAAILFAAGDLDAAEPAVRRTALDPAWQADARHLLGLIAHTRQNSPAARDHFVAAQSGSDMVAAHARAMLGQGCFKHNHFGDAVRYWQMVPPPLREAWDISRILPGTAMIAGVQALRGNRHRDAVEWFGLARQGAWPDARLPALHERALVLAGRAALEENNPTATADLLPLLDKVSRTVGANQSLAAILLARFHRLQGRLTEARDALHRAAPPTAATRRESAMIALADRDLADAEAHFIHARELEPAEPTTIRNLFWTHLSLGRTAMALALAGDVIERADRSIERRILEAMRTLLQGGPAVSAALADLSDDDEQRLVSAVVALGRLELTVPLLGLLVTARPASAVAKDAQTIACLRLAKQRLDRGDVPAAESLLLPLIKSRPVGAVRNLVGVCACLSQDYASAVLHFQETLRLAGDDPRVHQNLALAFTWQGDDDQAELCWSRFLDRLDVVPRPAGHVDYHRDLRFEVLRRLGNRHYDRDHFPAALGFFEKAHQLRPAHVETAERLFHLQAILGHHAPARVTLQRLREMNPKNMVYDLNELELIEVNSASALEKLLDALYHAVDTHAADPNAQDLAVSKVFPALQSRAEQLDRRFRELRNDHRKYAYDHYGWVESVRELRRLKRDLRRLKQAARYGAQLNVRETLRQKLNDLGGELDRKLAIVQRLEDEEN